MTHEERARHFACIKMHLEIAEVAHRTQMRMPSIVNFRDALSRLADLDAAFAAVERETLERAALACRAVSYGQAIDHCIAAIVALGQPQEATDDGSGAVTVGAAGGNGSPSALRIAEEK